MRLSRVPLGEQSRATRAPVHGVAQSFVGREYRCVAVPPGRRTAEERGRGARAEHTRPGVRTESAGGQYGRRARPGSAGGQDGRRTRPEPSGRAVQRRAARMAESIPGKAKVKPESSSRAGTTR
ncbi:hypothetical protein GCM10010327_66570 [Streptomyces nitrosporeus]|nr:hypothetical protein GCM10010327_66570 [Streptomyces nitrosporeus]